MHSLKSWKGGLIKQSWATAENVINGKMLSYHWSPSIHHPWHGSTNHVLPLLSRQRQKNEKFKVGPARQSASKGHVPKFNHLSSIQDPRGGGRELTPTSCSLSSTHNMAHSCIYTHKIQTCFKKKFKVIPSYTERSRQPFIKKVKKREVKTFSPTSVQ